MNYPLKQVDSSYNTFNLKFLSIAFLVLNCWNKAFGLCSTSSKFCTAHYSQSPIHIKKPRPGDRQVA